MNFQIFLVNSSSSGINIKSLKPGIFSDASSAFQLNDKTYYYFVTSQPTSINNIASLLKIDQSNVIGANFSNDIPLNDRFHFNYSESKFYAYNNRKSTSFFDLSSFIRNMGMNQVTINSTYFYYYEIKCEIKYAAIIFSLLPLFPQLNLQTTTKVKEIPIIIVKNISDKIPTQEFDHEIRNFCGQDSGITNVLYDSNSFCGDGVLRNFFIQFETLKYRDSFLNRFQAVFFKGRYLNLKIGIDDDEYLKISRYGIQINGFTQETNPRSNYREILSFMIKNFGDLYHYFIPRNNCYINAFFYNPQNSLKAVDWARNKGLNYFFISILI